MNKAVLGMIAVGLLSAGQVIEFRVSERYDGFTAMYDEFDMDRPYPIREADLLDTGKDITSLMFKARRELAEILSKRTPSSTFDDKKVKLTIKDGSDTWTIDQTGNMRHRKKTYRLTDESYGRLRLMLFGRLPLNDFDSIRVPFRRD